MKITMLRTYNGFQVSPDLQAWFESLPVGSEIEVDYKTDKRRTGQQNRALHLLMEMLSETLNAAGLDMKATLKPSVEIPWTPDRVKEFIWKPLQVAMLGIESTADVNTSDYTRVYDVLAHHMATKHGVTVPAWPDRFGNGD